MSLASPSRHSLDNGSGVEKVLDSDSKQEGTSKAKKSKLEAVKKLLKSPAVKRYEQSVSKEQKDWGTGNKFGGGPYRPLATTPGAGDYYTAKGATGG
ncbi:hypothetical protein AB5N19_13837 [Seiridium cardinale]|uniref:Uncharacterized protein n=1 Tax=Seiridium cardinale TaxID=138064 RepID=A0ABR2XJG5_9PEZI